MIDVVVGIVEKDGKILMIKRAKKEGNLEWAFPGGKVEENETKENACIREVYEETGINVQIKEIIGQRIHPDTQVKLTYFLCSYLNGEIKLLDKTEIVDVEYKNIKEFERDVKTDIFPPVFEYIKNNIK